MNRLAKSSLGFQLLQPLDAWSGYRIALTSVVVAALLFAAGVSLWRSSDPSGTEVSRSALHDAQQRLDRARAMTAQLPGMRARPGDGAPLIRWTVADALHELTTLAAQSGLRIGMIDRRRRRATGSRSSGR